MSPRTKTKDDPVAIATFWGKVGCVLLYIVQVFAFISASTWATQALAWQPIIQEWFQGASTWISGLKVGFLRDRILGLTYLSVPFGLCFMASIGYSHFRRSPRVLWCENPYFDKTYGDFSGTGEASPGRSTTKKGERKAILESW